MSSRTDGGTSPRQQRILVVDDDQDFCDMVVAALSRRLGWGAELVAVTTAERAAGLLSTDHWDLMLTDLNLPGASGFDLIRAARTHQQNICVLVTTGAATLDRAVAAMRLGAVDFLVKPVQPADLVDAVRKGMRSVDQRQ